LLLQDKKIISLSLMGGRPPRPGGTLYVLVQLHARVNHKAPHTPIDIHVYIWYNLLNTHRML
jgi:hypothetical protein